MPIMKKEEVKGIIRRITLEIQMTTVVLEVAVLIQTIKMVANI